MQRINYRNKSRKKSHLLCPYYAHLCIYRWAKPDSYHEEGDKENTLFLCGNNRNCTKSREPTKILKIREATTFGRL
jgi:hypothetical protein